jgi:2-desacetyl-2-hydroxyethyl bacteriochlorophyllide A dehydrogenase
MGPGHLAYQEINAPLPKDGFSIIQIKCIGICGTDLHAYEGTQPYFSYPRILGHELSGVIFQTNNKQFREGVAVTVLPYFNCGYCIACRSGKPNCCAELNVCGVHSDGGMVEYLQVPDESLVQNNGLSFEELALVEPLAIGAHAVRRAEIKKGEFVLVVGAGPIGLGTIEFARIAGAQVIAMDVEEKRLHFCLDKLGVQFVINPSKTNVVQELKTLTQGDMPITVIDATGNLNAINDSFQYIAQGGRYVLVGLQKQPLLVNHPEFHKREATLMSSRNATIIDFAHVMDCMKKKLIQPTTYITHRVGFEEMVEQFTGWLNPASGIIKAMVYM